ncbi:MAG: hypothetical protein QTN59_03940 [Candidatus Electrothrix communis]|nr:MAG: hypothetical protein QTN59_20890 [Candidatus Electrothrix communis]WLE97987.1 MAG: hypothetical protein QTN59_03940 [Candidatus Electrothrix communis]
MIYGDTEESYRKTTRLINRIRYQEKDGTPSRTLHEATEREGTALLEHITKKSEQILSRHGFEETGIYQEENPEYTQSVPFFWIRRRLTTQSLFVQKYVAFLMVT